MSRQCNELGEQYGCEQLIEFVCIRVEYVALKAVLYRCVVLPVWLSR